MVEIQLPCGPLMAVAGSRLGWSGLEKRLANFYFMRSHYDGINE